MSDIPRYSANPLWFPWSFVDNPLGKFCEYRDYVKLQAENGRLRHEQKMRAIPVEAKLMDRVAALQAENERLRASSFVTAVSSEEYEKLKAENERLRKAGHALALLQMPTDHSPERVKYECVVEWTNAVEAMDRNMRTLTPSNLRK
jgi:hypothetical protein